MVSPSHEFAKFDRFLVEILVCLRCRGELNISCDSGEVFLSCKRCGAKYPVKDGVPIMLEGQSDLGDGKN